MPQKNKLVRKKADSRQEKKLLAELSAALKRVKKLKAQRGTIERANRTWPGLMDRIEKQDTLESAWPLIPKAFHLAAQRAWDSLEEAEQRLLIERLRAMLRQDTYAPLWERSALPELVVLLIRYECVFGGDPVPPALLRKLVSFGNATGWALFVAIDHVLRGGQNPHEALATYARDVIADLARRPRQRQRLPVAR